MAKYIDVEALGIGIARAEIFANPEFARGWNNAIEIINNAPAADVAPTVELEDLRAKYQALVAEKDKNSGDTAETYTTGYRYGHRNGQIELLQQILDIFDGVSESEETNE